MESTEKKILIDVEVKATDALKNLAQMQMQVQELKETKKAEEQQDHRNEEVVEALNQKIKAATTVMNSYSREIKGNIQQQIAHKGSIDQMKSKLSEMTAAYNRLSAQERTSAKGGEMKQSIKSLTDELTKAEQELGNFHRQVGNYEIAGKSLRGELKAMTEQLAMMKLEGKENTKEYQDMAKKAGEFKDTMGDVKEETSNRASDTKHLDTANQALQGLTGSFTAYNAVLGIVDVNNKEFDDLLKKAQIGMAALAALTTIQNVIQKQSNLYRFASNIISKLTIGNNKKEAVTEIALNTTKKASIATDTLANAVKAKGTLATKAAAAMQWLWNAAISANPVVILLVAVMALIVGITKLTNALSSSKRAQEEATKAQEDYEKTASEVADKIEAINNKKEKDINKLSNAERKRILEMKKNGASQTQIAQYTLQMEQKKRDVTIKASKDIIKAKQAEQKVLQASLRAQQNYIKTLDAGSDKYAEATKKLQEMRQTMLGVNKALADAQNTIDTTTLDKQEAEQEAAQEKKEKAKERAEKAKEARQKAQERAYNNQLRLIEQQKTLQDKQNELDATGMTAEFAKLQEYEQKVFDEQQAFERRKIALQRKYNQITALEATRQQEVLKKSSEVFQKQQLQKLEEESKKQLELLEKSEQEQIEQAKKTADEQVKDFESAMLLKYGKSKEAEEAMARYRLQIYSKEVEEEDKIRESGLSKQIKDIEEKLNKQYAGDLSAFSDNELEKTKIEIEQQKARIEAKKNVKGANTTEDETQLRALEAKERQLQLNLDLMTTIKTAQAKYEANKEYLEKELTANKDNATKRAEIEERLTELTKSYNEEKIASFQKYTSQVSEIAGNINSLFSALGEAEQQEYEDKNTAEKASLQDKLDKGLISQKEYDTQVAKSDKALDAKKAEITKKQAQREKITKIFEIASSTAAGIMQAFAQTGPIAGIPLAAIVAAMGALQTATVLSTPLPKASKGMLLQGASHASGGVMIEAEGGEVIMNKKSTAMFLPLLSALNQAGGGVPFGRFGQWNDGGYSARNANNSNAEIVAQIKQMNQDIKQMKVFVAVEDINKGQKNYAKIADRGVY